MIFNTKQGGQEMTGYGKMRNPILRKILSIFIAFAMILALLQASAFKVDAASTVKVRLHFRNSKQWNDVYVYAWEKDPITASWPGDKLSIDSDGYYTYEVSKSSSSALNFIFNDGGSNQTGDLSLSAATLAGDADGVVERWVDGAENVRNNPLKGLPTVSGNKVTFKYTGAAGSSVYLAGSMNGWSTTANKMTESPAGVYTCTIELAPGEYQYKYVVNSNNWCKDSANEFEIIEAGGNSNSLAIVPGIVAESISVKKGNSMTLPSELAYLTATGGQGTKTVTYTSLTTGVTINGTKVTLAGSFSGSEFKVRAKTSSNETKDITVKIYQPGNITVKIHYDRTDNAESAWNAWIWAGNLGGSGHNLTSTGGEYIATYTVNAKDVNYVTALNFIMRKGDWLAQEGTRTIDLSNVMSGTVHTYVNKDGSYNTDYSQAVLGTKIKNVDYNRNTNKIVVTASGPISSADKAFTVKKTDGSTIAVTGVTNAGTTYQLSLGEDLTSLVKVCGTYKLVYDGNEYYVSMPNVYKTAEFENTYTYTGNDLGATWSSSATNFRVWAPTAEKVQVQLYATGSDSESGSKKLGTHTMTKDSKGTWVAKVSGDLNGVYYTYLVTVNGKTVEACDPYARTTGVNGNRAMVLNMDSTDPKGWGSDVSPNKGMTYTDAIIYELHVRDLSINAESGVKSEWRGKFLGLTEKGTTNSSGIPTGLDHIRDLGVTHVHLLPSYDFGSIDETMTEAQKEANTSKQFNWGYDPVNYNVPEGSYSTNPYDGAIRVKEMKQMVQALHGSGINVIMDVVYNHVYDAGQFGFNMIVPNYFSRTNPDGSYSNGSGCGNDTASERAMVRKYIVDSVKYWADEYHIDGFRFDLVGLLDAQTINQIVEEVHKTHPYVIFYGEGWTMNTAVEPGNTVMATQQNAYATPKFAYFSDTLRDFLKGKNDEVSWGYVQNTSDGDPEGTLMECFLANTGWIQNPTQVINYASCHDNYTLMDKINATKKSSSMADRIKMNNLAAAIYMTAEGIPLIHAGEELLRTKVDKNGHIIHNSYNSPDYINSLKWGDLSSKDYQNVRDYYKGLIEFRKNHAVLRLTTKADVKKYVSATWIDENVVMFSFAGKDKVASEVSDGVVIIFNPNPSAKTFNMYEAGVASGTWKICVNDTKAGTDSLGTVTDGKVTVPAISALILVKGETVDKNSVYVKNAVSDNDYDDETDKPSSGNDDKPSGGNDDKPSGGNDDKPSGGNDDKPSGGDDDKPSGGDDDNPSGGNDDTPSDGDDDKPSGDNDNKPSDEDETVKPEDVVIEDVEIEDDKEAIDKLPITDDDKEAIENGEEISISLDVKDVTGNVSQSDIGKFAAALGDNRIGSYVDISIWKQVGSKDREFVATTNGKISIKVTIPVGLRSGDGVERTFTIYGLSEGTVTEYEVVYNATDSTLTFETDKSCIYAIAYRDADNGKKEKDKSFPWAIPVVIIIAGGVATGFVVYKKKQQKPHTEIKE